MEEKSYNTMPECSICSANAPMQDSMTLSSDLMAQELNQFIYVSKYDENLANIHEYNSAPQNNSTH